jgi:hypothetical protein
MLAGLPLAGLASWTGWQVLDELDLLVLAAAAGGYARMASSAAPSPSARRAAGVSLAAVVVIMLVLVADGWGLWRGLSAWDGGRFGWFDGYTEPFNSLRLAKSLPLAVLVTPLLVRELRISQSRVVGLIGVGMVTGLTLASIAVGWERLAFTGLLDFSTDYRATGPFWEMHVGGAALDGYLALTAPFLIWALLRARGPLQWGVLAVSSILAVYAALVTFSRGVYLGVPLGLLVAIVLLSRQRNANFLPALRGGLPGWVCVILAATAGAVMTFKAGGYRGTGAMLGAMLLMLPLGAQARSLRPGDWILAVVPGLFLGGLGVALAPLVPKGVYFLHASLFIATGALVLNARKRAARAWKIAALGGFVWLLVSAVSVAGYWGGNDAYANSAPIGIGLLLLLGWNGAAREALWPDDLRLQGMLGGLVIAVTSVAAVLGGGEYMKDRFSTSEADFAGRIRHWNEGLAYLDGGTDWAFGKGFGTFPISSLFSARDSMFPGAYQIVTQSGAKHLVLSGSRFMSDRNEWLRVSQRVAAVNGTYRVTFDARADRQVRFHLEVCEQHLLYWFGCAIKEQGVGAKPGQWQTFEVELDGRELTGGRWYAPRLAFFSMAVASLGQRVEVDNVRLVGPAGRDLLINGDFSGDMARWFVISERVHLPWHIKNIFLNVLFDQGAIGLVLLVALLIGALWRLVAGQAREHPLAPFTTAAICAFVVVGLFDSLLDVPRIAFVFYFAVLMAYALRNPSSVKGTRGNAGIAGQREDPES